MSILSLLSTNTNACRPLPKTRPNLEMHQNEMIKVPKLLHAPTVPCLPVQCVPHSVSMPGSSQLPTPLESFLSNYLAYAGHGKARRNTTFPVYLYHALLLLRVPVTMADDRTPRYQLTAGITVTCGDHGRITQAPTADYPGKVIHRTAETPFLSADGFSGTSVSLYLFPDVYRL